jgi:hypothetical protein
MPREGRLFEPAFLLLGSVDDQALKTFACGSPEPGL